jgi:hypothetical protein
MHSTAEGGSDETSTEIHAINPSDLSLTRDPRMERESFGFSLGFTPRHYWQRTPRWEQVSRTLTRDYTFDINEPPMVSPLTTCDLVSHCPLYPGGGGVHTAR